MLFPRAFPLTNTVTDSLFCGFPGIALDMASIFEEHHLCHNSSQLSSEQFCNAEGIYVREENKFIFNKVLVGRTAQARFKLTNNNKVPCVLSLAIKCVGARVRRVKALWVLNECIQEYL